MDQGFRYFVRCIAKAAGCLDIPEGFAAYDDRRGERSRHMKLVRSWVGVSAYEREAPRTMLKACVDISRVREDLADIINFAIEELVRKRYELPGGHDRSDAKDGSRRAYRLR